MNKFKDTYISFAPRIRVEWTPCLYYYMNGKRKLHKKMFDRKYGFSTLQYFHKELGIEGLKQT